MSYVTQIGRKERTYSIQALDIRNMFIDDQHELIRHRWFASSAGARDQRHGVSGSSVLSSVATVARCITQFYIESLNSHGHQAVERQRW